MTQTAVAEKVGLSEEDVEALAGDLAEVYGLQDLADQRQREQELECAREQVRGLGKKGVGAAEIGRIILSIASRGEGKPAWSSFALGVAMNMDRSRELVDAESGEAWKRIRAGRWGELCPPDKADCAGYSQVLHRRSGTDLPCPIAETGCPWKMERDQVRLNRKLEAVGVEAQWRCAREDQMLPTIGEVVRQITGDIAAAVRDGLNVYLAGRMCTGKTCGAAIIMRYAVAAGMTGGWRTGYQISTGRMPEALAAVDVMVVDDLGAGIGDPDKIRLWLDKRGGARQDGLTVFTGNAAREDLEARADYLRVSAWMFVKPRDGKPLQTITCWQPLEGLVMDEVPLWARDAWATASYPAG